MVIADTHFISIYKFYSVLIIKPLFDIDNMYPFGYRCTYLGIGVPICIHMFNYY
jgi:hypothetical protein